MKNFLIGAASVAFCYGANAADLMPYSNFVTANAIMGIQHTISNRALAAKSEPRRVVRTIRTVHTSPDRYGTMRYYGEFGDDTGILPMIGRAGGDEELTPVRLGFDFAHSDDTLEFSGIEDIDSKTNVARVSVSPKIGSGDLEIFAGYAGHHSRNSSLDIDGDGAFFGVASGANLNGLDTGVVINVGVMANTAGSSITTRDFENIWMAVTAGAGYDIELMPAVVLRPAIVAEYMWVNAQNYIAKNGDNVDVKNINLFELSPSLGIDFKLQDGWRIGGAASYVMNMQNGGKISVAYTDWPELDTRNYIEYGVNFGRRTERMDLSFNLGRHEIGRHGWHGGFGISYLF